MRKSKEFYLEYRANLLAAAFSSISAIRMGVDLVNLSEIPERESYGLRPWIRGGFNLPVVNRGGVTRVEIFDNEHDSVAIVVYSADHVGREFVKFSVVCDMQELSDRLAKLLDVK